MRSSLRTVAADPTTQPPRLAELARHSDGQVRLAAYQNPALPTELLLSLLAQGKPGAWANPLTPLLLLEGKTPPKLDQAIFRCASQMGTCPYPEVVARVAPVVRERAEEAWRTSESARWMLQRLVAQTCKVDVGDARHLRLTRVAVVLVKETLASAPTLTPDLTAALTLLQEWTQKPHALLASAARDLYMPTYIERRAIMPYLDTPPFHVVSAIDHLHTSIAQAAMNYHAATAYETALQRAALHKGRGRRRHDASMAEVVRTMLPRFPF